MTYTAIKISKLENLSQDWYIIWACICFLCCNSITVRCYGCTKLLYERVVICQILWRVQQLVSFAIYLFGKRVLIPKNLNIFGRIYRLVLWIQTIDFWSNRLFLILFHIGIVILEVLSDGLFKGKNSYNILVINAFIFPRVRVPGILL